MMCLKHANCKSYSKQTVYRNQRSMRTDYQHLQHSKRHGSVFIPSLPVHRFQLCVSDLPPSSFVTHLLRPLQSARQSQESPTLFVLTPRAAAVWEGEQRAGEGEVRVPQPSGLKTARRGGGGHTAPGRGRKPADRRIKLFFAGL